MRKFGIELELVAPANLVREHVSPLTAAKNVLMTAGIISRTNTHFGRNYEAWQVKPDGSIQPYDRGAEVVSRILPATAESYAETHRAVTALNTAGFGINRTCGFHVHISVADQPMHIRQLIVLRYAQVQANINGMLPPSRRNNNFCQALSPSQRQQLAFIIDTNGAGAGISVGRYCVTNMAWLSSGDQSRIEFRQAAGTCSANKVVGWVRFLQEMIDEVVMRATLPGVSFGRAGTAAPRPVPAAPVIAHPASVVPRMRPGSDAHRALEQVRTTGVITAVWAADQGIGENVLRRIIVGFRRHGADLNTVRTDRGPNYVLNGARTLPMTAEQVFASAAVAAVAMRPAAPVTMDRPTVTRATDFVAYAFEAGMTTETREWCDDRRDSFNASEDQAQVA